LISLEEEEKWVNRHVLITDGMSQPLRLRLVVENDLIGFYAPL
jgi:hypothetical protein